MGKCFEPKTRRDLIGTCNSGRHGYRTLNCSSPILQ